jgi:hypothetical protein
MSRVWRQKGIVERLRLLVAEGHSADQIAARLSAERGETISRNAVIGKCDRERFQLFGGVLRRNRPPEVKAPPAKPAPTISQALLVRTPMPPRGNEPEPKGTNPPGTCQWLHGEAEDRLFCGHPSHEDKAWCAYHCHQVFDYARTEQIHNAIKKQVKRALR